jgi:hypothetical protein
MPPTNYILSNSQDLAKQVLRKANKENALKDDKQFGFTKRWFNAKAQRKKPAKVAQLYFEPFAFPFVPLASL